MVISRVMGEIFLSFFFFFLLRFNKINQYSFHAMVCDGIPRMVILTPRKRNFITAIKLAPCVLFWIIIKKKKKRRKKREKYSLLIRAYLQVDGRKSVGSERMVFYAVAGW